MKVGAGDNLGSGPAGGRSSDGRQRQGRPSDMSGEAGSAPGRARATYAALDLGTNNCRLLIARATDDGFRVVDAFSRIVRLGEGVSASGRLNEEAIGRAMGALTICRDKMRNRGVTRARLIATEACRSADNGAEFIARVRDRIGIELEMIDRETEATLAATGCTQLIDPESDGAVLFDIGGGSSEIVRLRRSADCKAGPPLPDIQGWISLRHGVVTLAEQYGGVDVTPEIYEAMVGEISAMIAPFAAEHAGLCGAGTHMLGTSGTVTTIAGVHLNLPRYDRNQVDGCWLSEQDIDGVMDRLRDMSYRDRVASPCIGAERADLVLAGCAILEAIRRAFPCQRLRVADRGLREGMLVGMMRADGAWDGVRAVAS